jgi:hypothetical protein
MNVGETMQMFVYQGSAGTIGGNANRRISLSAILLVDETYGLIANNSVNVLEGGAVSSQLSISNWSPIPSNFTGFLDGAQLASSWSRQYTRDTVQKLIFLSGQSTVLVSGTQTNEGTVDIQGFPEVIDTALAENVRGVVSGIAYNTGTGEIKQMLKGYTIALTSTTMRIFLRAEAFSGIDNIVTGSRIEITYEIAYKYQ